MVYTFEIASQPFQGGTVIGTTGLNVSMIGEGAIVRLTLAKQIADTVRDWILLEKLPPGQILAERELSGLLDVSRTPMREALRLLASEGLIEMVPNRRPRVADPSLEEVEALLDVHIVLEALGTEKAAEKITGARIDGLEDLQGRMLALTDSGNDLEFFRLDMDFHCGIMAASGNAALCETHAQYNSRLFRARFMSSRLHPGRPLMRSQHGDVLEALKQRDAVTASQIMRKHLEQLKRNIAMLYAERGDGSATDTK